MRKLLMIGLILLSGGAYNSAFAAEIFECTAQTQGMTQCIALKQCECKLFRTSLLNNDPGGYRWDCGITKPSCLDTNKISDRENVRPYDGPDSVYIERN